MRRLISLLLPLVALMAACGGDDDTTEVGSDTEPTDAQVSVSTEVPAEGSTTAVDVPAMFDFVADDVRGGEVIGADYANRDLVVWFWAPWCTNCNREAPDMADLIAERGDDVAFLGMAGLADVGDMEDFVERHGLDGMPHAISPDGAIWQNFGVTSQSVFVFVDDDGSVTRTEYGVQGPDALNAAIDDLLAS